MMEYDLAYEEDNQRLPSFQQLLRTAGQPSFNSAYKQNQQQYLDDFDLSVNEESLSYFLCMKTGMVYLGSMGVFGTYQVAKSVATRQLQFKQIAGSLAANVPRRVNSVASVVFCATSAYAISALTRGKRDSWNYVLVGGAFGGWIGHRFVTKMNITPRRPALFLGWALGTLFSGSFIYLYEYGFDCRYPKYRVHKLFK
uniref:Uncharacterized protein n=1 Tax=Vannella robusta TaxID=1487602 RepID=A0A7S4M9D1_9EUKA|mmetsp:Transcript_15266/g.19372  ORF Transcript_15266/g.19372 Transcript_15266/m.19372 type:complete len:198 (+) Transcript_15266:1-594(+)